MRSVQKVMTESFWSNQTLIIDCDKGTFYTQVISLHEHTLSIAHPIDDERQVLNLSIQDGPVSVYFFDDNRNMFLFKSTLNVEGNKIYLIKPETVQKIQRRKFFRVPATLEITLMTESGEKFNYLTANISGGGASVICPDAEQFAIGAQMTCSLYLEKKNGQQISFTARVVRIDSTSGQKLLILHFAEINESQRSQLIRFCQKRELEIYNKIGKNTL